MLNISRTEKRQYFLFQSQLNKATTGYSQRLNDTNLYTDYETSGMKAW